MSLVVTRGAGRNGRRALCPGETRGEQGRAGESRRDQGRDQERPGESRAGGKADVFLNTLTGSLVFPIHLRIVKSIEGEQRLSFFGNAASLYFR